ncbi:MAG: MAPEG family protein [Pseudomonadota bacterium]
MVFPITGLFAALFAIALVGLGVFVGLYRVKQQIPFLDGGDVVLTQRMRAHGNFIEYVPIALIAMALVEANGAPVTLLYGLGGVLLVGRLLHAATLLSGNPWGAGRALGMVGTTGPLVVASLWLIWAFAIEAWA